METSKTIRALQLDLALGRIQDDRGPDIALDAEMTAALRHLHELAARPVPDSSFVHSLGQRLSDAAIIAERAGQAKPGMPNGHARPAALPGGILRPPSRPWWQRFEIAATMLVIAVLGGYFALLGYGQTDQQDPPPRSIANQSVEHVEPVQIRIDTLLLEAPVKRRSSDVSPTAAPGSSVDLAMAWKDGERVWEPVPSDNWAALWHDDLADSHDGGNLVLSAGAPFWSSMPTLFERLPDLETGDRIAITSADGRVFPYDVEWIRTFAATTDEQDQEIYGPTGSDSLTLITGTGDVDRPTGRYAEVLVVRARLAKVTPPRPDGAAPVQLRIDAIEVGASIEGIQPIGGDVATPTAGDIWTVGWRDDNPIAVPEPSGPWDVAWQDDSPAPGDGSNVVLRGHLDYWDTGTAIFGDLQELTASDRIEITRDDGDVFAYTVEWSRRFPIDAREDEQREILGPTPGESLTLMTSAGAYNRETMNFPEVLIVRAQFLGSTSLRTVFVPDPRECQAAPRSVADLDAAATRVLSAPYPAATPTSVADQPGAAVDAATMDAVIAAERELVACLNASDALGAYAHYTDAGLDRLLQWAIAPAESSGSTFEWAPDFSELSTPTPPRPEAERLALSAVEDVRLLPDGRIAALVTIGPGSADMLGVPTDVPVLHIFAPGERLLIDDFVVPSLAEPMGS